MVRRDLAPCQNVIELGGCFGLISAVIRQAIGPDARHIAVEADAGLARACAENAVIGANPQCTSTIVAAVDYSGRDTVTFQTGHNAHVGHVPGAGEVGATGKPVATTTLRKLAALLPDGPFALVCDIEGTELALFQADADLLPRITLLVLETHPKVYSGGEADLAQMVATITASGLRVVEEAEQVICFTRSAT